MHREEMRMFLRKKRQGVSAEPANNINGRHLERGRRRADQPRQFLVRVVAKRAIRTIGVGRLEKRFPSIVTIVAPDYGFEQIEHNPLHSFFLCTQRGNRPHSRSLALLIQGFGPYSNRN
jgi:hypothetical protein